MRAKLINEIRQGVEGSGLGAIGVGRTSMFKGYDAIKKLSPNFEERCYPIIDNPMTASIDVAIEKIAKIFDCDIDDMLIMRSFGKESITTWKFINNVVLGADEIILHKDVVMKAGRVIKDNGFMEDYYLMASKNWQVAKIAVGTASTNDYYLIRYK